MEARPSPRAIPSVAGSSEPPCVAASCAGSVTIAPATRAPSPSRRDAAGPGSGGSVTRDRRSTPSRCCSGTGSTRAVRTGSGPRDRRCTVEHGHGWWQRRLERMRRGGWMGGRGRRRQPASHGRPVVVGHGCNPVGALRRRTHLVRMQRDAPITESGSRCWRSRPRVRRRRRRARPRSRSTLRRRRGTGSTPRSPRASPAGGVVRPTSRCGTPQRG